MEKEMNVETAQFHPIKWLENIGNFLTVENRDLKPLNSKKGKQSVQHTVLTIELQPN